MTTAWEILRAAGVPWGPIGGASMGPLDAAAIVAAFSDVQAAALDERQRDALYAWLRALSDHWPARFEEIFADGGSRLAQLADPARDENRFIKLRRLALDQLAGRL